MGVGGDRSQFLGEGGRMDEDMLFSTGRRGVTEQVEPDTRHTPRESARGENKAAVLLHKLWGLPQKKHTQESRFQSGTANWTAGMDVAHEEDETPTKKECTISSGGQPPPC